MENRYGPTDVRGLLLEGGRGKPDGLEGAARLPIEEKKSWWFEAKGSEEML
jgi:hypothetical protein